MKIIISEIENKSDKTENINFSEIIEEFNPNVPVSAELNIKLIDSIVKITGRIKAVLILTCDYCLEEFTKEIDIKIDEMYERGNLNCNSHKEFEISDNNFVQDLNGNNEIDLTDFVYQCIILHIPNQLVCGINCKGKENLDKYMKKDFTDPRLEIFKNIKVEKE